MGLSARVYINIKHCDNPEHSDFTAYVIDKSWKHKIKNLNEGGDYTGESVFRACDYTYSTHSRFREYLISLSGVQGVLDGNGEIICSALREDMPFYEFIDFADNEGCFDWDTAIALLPHFDKYAELNNKHINTYMSEKYKSWHEAIKIAAQSKGVVVFS